MKKYIYNFLDKLDFDLEKHIAMLGSKGANLREMSSLALPVPAGFTISTEACRYYFKNNQSLPVSLPKEIEEHVAKLESQTNRKFGSISNPLIISVRSGASVSMPGMMDTILNLGLNEEIVEGFAIAINEIFAYDCYLRFYEMYSDVVLGIPHEMFDKIKYEVLSENHLKPTDLKKTYVLEIINRYKKLLQKHSLSIPESPPEQLRLAIIAVIKSWNSQRAKVYRKLNNIDEDLGTAVTIQSMVFGNYDEKSSTGVLFTRNPVNGVRELYGEYLPKAQGEDIVAGKHTPLYLSGSENSLKSTFPKIYNELEMISDRLENHYKDMQDIEFTIQSGNLFILQTRSGKRSPAASIKIAVDLFSEHKISKEQALLNIDVNSIDNLLHPTISKKSKAKPEIKGLAASPGAVTGRVVFSTEAAEEYHFDSNVILLRNDTSPEDIKGMSISKGIVTSRGGLTSHAAVVARGMGKPCVCGVSDMHIDLENNVAYFNSKQINQLDIITLDGSTGDIYIGSVEVIPAQTSEEFKEILNWADEYRSLSIRANGESVNDIRASIEFGAEGIGLCRTEHMFFEKEKISLVRQMIICQSYDERKEILDKLLPLHTADFISIFELVREKPVNIRLIDPPLHEFLPKDDLEIEQLSFAMKTDIKLIKYQLDRMSEFNPMLGHRGARLGVTHPDIYEMQIEAIITAAIKAKANGIDVNVEIMLPLISNEVELIYLKKLVTNKAQEVMITLGYQIEYKIGTMIELPRAAIISDKIAKHVDYFSFGTNDLTQTVYGISRDDISGFMYEYKSNNIFKEDPFHTIDEEGVGEVIIMSSNRGLKANKSLKIGICGEHGGDPKSIEFFHKIGLDYVSCSPYRIPTAKIAAAQANIRFKR